MIGKVLGAVLYAAMFAALVLVHVVRRAVGLDGRGGDRDARIPAE